MSLQTVTRGDSKWGGNETLKLWRVKRKTGDKKQKFKTVAIFYSERLKQVKHFCFVNNINILRDYG